MPRTPTVVLVDLAHRETPSAANDNDATMLALARISASREGLRKLVRALARAAAVQEHKRSLAHTDTPEAA